MLFNKLDFNKLLLEKEMNNSLLAAKLEISRQAVSLWMSSGKFPKSMVPKLRKILGSDLDKCLTNLESTPLQPPGSIPYFNIDFCGGFDLIENSLQNQPDAYISDPLFTGSQYVVRCSGDSMGDKIPNGCYLGIRRIDVSDILYGEIYAVVTNANRTIKYLRKSKLANHILFVPENIVSYDAQDVAIDKIKSVWTVVAYGLKIN